MERLSPLATWSCRLGVLALSAFALMVALAPLGLGAEDLVMPDLVFLILAIWQIRRPEVVSLALVLLVSLVADLLRGAPLGLGTLALLGALEVLARLRDSLGRSPFLVEWLTVALVFAGMIAAQCLALWLTFTPRPALAALGQHVLGTALAYPLVLLVLRALFPLGRAAGRQGSLP
ncbi:MAG TPA: rod shape-determining protein MreD [Paracoccaceae bacterium]|nr:rod shape-determining protein MreD [Paracoccaceae bacterium]